MQITIDVPEKVVQRAEELGVPVEQFVSQVLDENAGEDAPPGFIRFGRSTMTPEEAGARIREFASRHTLGGLKIKDLIEEGRRY